MTLARTVGAALLTLAAPIAATAAPSGEPHYPAIATGLAIPVGAEQPQPLLPQTARIPARGRFVLVDAAAARLFMIENGQIVDSMKVIVGKPGHSTPEIRSILYQATINPYWNVPVDLARTLIAPNVLEQGQSYLKERGYQVVTKFGDGARVLDPGDVDWQAVADGTETVHVRQLPGPANSMGELKIGFPNNNGIFLHDTPRKALFDEAERTFSSGCVRLEDAPRFASWLLMREPQLDGGEVERSVPLPHPVPILITYLDDRAQTRLAALR